MEEEIKKEIDISKDIQETSKIEPVVSTEVAEKEEEISKAISKTPVTYDELEKRKKKAINFLKKKKDWAYYLILAFIVFIGVYIRTRNISKLKDITTGTWTLGPDLDPFLFLRWAKEIVENGSLMVWDMMRYVPLGYNTAGEMKLLSYLIAWFHNFLSVFSLTDSVTYSAILFPVVMFALTTIAFFLFAKKIFYKENKKIRNIIALIATAFFIVIPSLLPRTIAGIPEKESAAFFFIFIAFYFFLEAFTSEKIKRGLIFGILAGVATGLLALIWGGATFVFLTITGAVLFAFLLGKIDKKRFYYFVLWILSFSVIMIPFSTRYTIKGLITSTTTGIAVVLIFVILLNFYLLKTKKFGFEKIKLPKQIISLIIILIILGIFSSIFFGLSFIPDKINSVISQTVHPLSQSRFGLTVAENKQPFFINDWKNSFGPVFQNIPLFFWLFFIGSVVLFNSLIKKLRKKERIILTFSYLIFLFCLIFSKYSPNSVLDGVSGLSLVVYFGGVLFFLGSLGYFYFKRYKENEFSVFKEFNLAYILYFIILTMTIIGARGAIRLIMVLGAVSPVVVSFLIVKASQRYLKEKDDAMKLFMGIITLLIITASIFTMWGYYQSDRYSAENFAPIDSYHQQWQKAMGWVRDNTQQNAVFAHWWDYGYWLQSIGERATILDGGNSIVYWDYLMGRYVLTGDNERDALEFLYAHNGTHLLIDSTEIGKYTAYSSIGSDENYDRFSWITTFSMDEAQTQETKEEITYVYVGGTLLDEDIIWNENGKEIFLPSKSAGVGAILLRMDENGKILQPEGIFVYNREQYKIPLRFAYFDEELHNFGSGLDAGIFLYPTTKIVSEGVNVNKIGAAMYLSRRTIHSQLANLYLFNQESDYFNLVHTESSFVIDGLKEQGMNVGEFVNYQGFQGPIKIWEINYPSDIELKQEYLETEFPNEDLWKVKSGEYN